MKTQATRITPLEPTFPRKEPPGSPCGPCKTRKMTKAERKKYGPAVPVPDRLVYAKQYAERHVASMDYQLAVIGIENTVQANVQKRLMPTRGRHRKGTLR